jgi:hypothetical protein
VLAAAPPLMPFLKGKTLFTKVLACARYNLWLDDLFPEIDRLYSHLDIADLVEIRVP